MAEDDIDSSQQQAANGATSGAGAGAVQQTAASSGSAGGSSGGGGPVGSGNYEVKQGDCIESIAMDHGLFWQTIWNHPDNLDLKNARKNPNVLREGDKVFVPDLRPKQESGATEQRHKFKRKGVPSKISIILKDEKGQPRPNLDYVLEIDGQLSQGKTDAAGRLQHPIPPNAQRGKIIIGTGPGKEEYALQLGHLDPITEISGVQARLKNLGFDCGQADGALNDETRQAIRNFQAKCNLQETGEPDQATRDKLQQEHGS